MPGVVAVTTGRGVNLETDIKTGSGDGDTTPYFGKGLIPWTDDDAPGSSGSGNANIHNTILFQKALNLMGYQIFDPLYIPAKSYYLRPGLVISGLGGRINTGGGLMYLMAEIDRAYYAGPNGPLKNVSRLQFTGPDTVPCIDYRGFGWYIEPLVLNGFQVSAEADVAAAINGTGVFATRRSVGLQVSYYSGNPAVGNLWSGGMIMFGFKKGVYIPDGSNNRDRICMKQLTGILCDVVFQNDFNQSVFDWIGRLEVIYPCDYAVVFNAAGDMRVDFGVMEASATTPRSNTFLKVNSSGLNSPRFNVDHLGIDNTAIPGFKVLEIGTGANNCLIQMGLYIDNNHVGSGYSDDPIVKLPAGWNASTLASNKITIRLDGVGMSPTTAALYPR
jgi:hypothetical protein